MEKVLPTAAVAQKPIFMIQHAAFANTCATTESDALSGSMSTVAKQLLGQYPQVFHFSGHSHYPLNDTAKLWVNQNGQVQSNGGISVSGSPTVVLKDGAYAL